MAMDAWISRVLLLMTTRLHGIAIIMIVCVLLVDLDQQPAKHVKQESLALKWDNHQVLHAPTAQQERIVWLVRHPAPTAERESIARAV